MSDPENMYKEPDESILRTENTGNIAGQGVGTGEERKEPLVAEKPIIVEVHLSTSRRLAILVDDKEVAVGMLIQPMHQSGGVGLDHKPVFKALTFE